MKNKQTIAREYTERLSTLAIIIISIIVLIGSAAAVPTHVDDAANQDGTSAHKSVTVVANFGINQ